MHSSSSFIATSFFTLALVACTPSSTTTTPMASSSSSFAVASSLSSSQDGTNPIISTPKVGALVKSPVTVKGKARGTWFFEASLPVLVTDSHNNVIASAAAQADGEWMTTEYVDFSVTIPFSTNQPFGFIVIKKDNPSGLPENDAQIKIPVTFKP